jgi:PAS domain S-box-containing protein
MHREMKGEEVSMFGRPSRFPFLDRLIVVPDFLDEEQAMKGRFLVIFSWANVISFIVAMIAVLVISPEQFGRPLAVIVALALLFSFVFFLVNRGKVKLASYLVVGTLWLLGTVFAYTAGGVHAAGYTGYFVVMFLAGILLGGRALFIMSVICGLSGLWMVYLESIGKLPVPQYHTTSLIYWGAGFVFMFILALMQYYNNRQVKNSLNRARAELDERTRAEQALRESDARYKLISENSADVIWLMDVASLRLRYISPSVFNLLGYTAEEALSLPITQFVSPTFESVATYGLASRIAGLMAGDESQRIVVQQIQHVRKDGSQIPVEMVTRLITDPDGQVRQVLGVTRDITERERAFAELQASEKRYHSVISAMAEGIVLYGADGKVVDCNASAEKILGLLVEQMLGNAAIHPGWRVIHEDGKPFLPEEYPSEVTLRTGEPCLNVVMGIFRLDDTLVWVSVNTQPLEKPGEQRPAGVMASFSDITDRLRAQQGLRESEEKFSKAFLSSPDAIVISSLTDGRYLEVNDSFLRDTGYARDEIIGFTALERNVWASVEERDRLVAILHEKGFVRNMEARYRRKSGEVRDALISAELIELSSGNKHLLAVVRDVTERKQADALQATVYQIANAAQTAHSLQELYEQIHQQVARVLSAGNFYIALYDEDNDLLRFPYSADEKDPIREAIRPREGLTAHVLKTGKSLLYFSDQPEPGLIVFGTLPKVWLGVPLTVDGKTIGVMAVQHYSDATVYGEREQRMLEFVSSQVATTIDRKRASEILQKNQASLEMAQAIAHLGSWEFDPQTGAWQSWSKEMFHLFGFDPAAGVPEFSKWLELVHPDERDSLLKAQKTAIETGALTSVDFRIGPALGKTRYFRANIHPVIDANGQVFHISGTMLDVTENRQMEMDIRERVKELTCLFNVGTLLQGEIESEEIVCQQVVEFLVPAMQFPALTVPLIELRGRRFTTDGFSETLSHNLSTQIRADGQVCGQIFVYYRENEPFIIPEEQTLLDNIARMLGMWLERRQAGSNALYRQKLLEKVIKLGKNISAITDFQACLREIYRSVRYELMFDRVGLFLYDRETQDAQGAYGTSTTGEMEDTSWYKTNVAHWWIWDDALKTPTGMSLIEDYQAVVNPPPDSDMYGVKQYVTLAAWVGDKPVAMISVDNLLSHRVMFEADLEALQLFAGYAGLAIENARLNAGLEQRVAERTEEVRRSEATYRALFENSNDGIFLMSPTGEDLAANRQALRMLGYTEDEYKEMTRRTPNTMAVPEQKADADARFAAALRGEFVPLYERTFIGKDGRKVEVEINLSPVRDTTGNIIMVQSVVRDITERKKAEEALRESRDKLSEANAALEKASRMKDEFLASMSHELRTPLTGILGLSETLQMPTFGPLSEKQARAVKNIEASGRHLLELINDILDLSKIEAGKLDMQFDLTSVSDVCQSSLQLVKGMAAQKHILVSFAMEPATMMVRADARRLKQMLVNLLSNAVKFTAENGQVGLDVRGDEANQSIALTVWDTGIGIKPEDLHKLFKPFIQLDSSLARQYSGTGLGLSLVHRMAELHGGSVHVESEPGVGSRFTIHLPWVVVMPEIRNQARESEPVGKESTGALALPLVSVETPRTITVLLADDNEVLLEMLSDFLESREYNVVSARSGYELLERAPEVHPDIVLIDIQMPGLDGMETIRRLRAHSDPKLAQIPIVAVTALAMTGDREKCLDAGANEYLSKPVGLKQLEELIQKLTHQA